MRSQKRSALKTASTLASRKEFICLEIKDYVRLVEVVSCGKRNLRISSSLRFEEAIKAANIVLKKEASNRV
jgi:hypothetical protein